MLNPFMKFDNPKYLDSIKIENVSDVENFKKIRIMKDNFYWIIFFIIFLIII